MRSFIALAAVVAALTGYPAVAEDAAEQDAVRIEADQEAKAFIFIIDDEPVALLNREGLHVRDVVSTGEGIRNRPEDFKSQLAKTEKND